MGEQVGNALGRGLNVVNSVIALRNGQFAQQQVAQAAALSNPAVRAGLVGHPFQAGGLGLSGGQRAIPVSQPTAPPTTESPYGPTQPTSQVNVPQNFAWQPNLPPLDPEQQLKQIQAQAGIDLSVNDPTTFRTANDAGTPEDVGAIIRRSGPQGISNVTARTGGLGMFQLSPSQYVPLGNGQYGLVDAQGSLKSVGAIPGAAANAVIDRQQEARRTLGGGGVQPLSQPTPPPDAGTTMVATPRGQMKVPTAMMEAANVPQPVAATTTPAPAPAAPQRQPFNGTSIPFHQLDPNAPMSAVIQAQQPQAAYPSPAPQAQAPSPPPAPSSQQVQPYEMPTPAPGQISPPEPTYNPFLGDFSRQPPPGGSVTAMTTKDSATGITTTQSPSGPKLDPMQIKAYALNGSPDLTKLTPDGARYLLDQEKIAEARKAANAALLQGTASEETARIANIMSISQALSELRWLGPGIYQYVGKKDSLAGMQRGLAGLSVSGDPAFERVKSLTSQIRLLAFTFGGQQLTETEAARVDAMIPLITDSPAAFKMKAMRTSDVLQKQMEILLAGRGAHLAPSAVQNIQDTYQQIKIIPPSEMPNEAP